MAFFDDFDRFLAQQAQQEPENNPTQTAPDPDANDTFAAKMGYTDTNTVRAIKSAKRFEKSLSRRSEKSLSNRYHSFAPRESRDDSLRDRMASYKYKKAASSRCVSGPKETKIHKTPLSLKRRHISIASDKSFQPRDPRFASEECPLRKEEDGEGWRLRKAYAFLDEAMDRDVKIIEKTILRTKAQMKSAYHRKRNAEGAENANANGNAETKVRAEREMRKGKAAVTALKRELIALNNRKNGVAERDLEQATKSEMRNTELRRVREGHKAAYHHNLQRTRFGAVKWGKAGQGQRDIQTVYLEKKFEGLKKEGRLESYMNKKRKRVNQKFRKALKKHSGAGWNDS